MPSFVLSEHMRVLLAHGRGRISIEKKSREWCAVVTDKVSGRRYAAPASGWGHAVVLANCIARDSSHARLLWWEECPDARV